jgi:hypothetical protein
MATVSSSLSSKPAATVFSSLASKLVATVISRTRPQGVR